MKIRHSPFALAFVLASVAIAQPGPPQQGRGGDGPPPMERGRGGAPPPPPPGRPPLGPLEAGQRGRWWANPEMAQKLSLTEDQHKKMDDIFQQHRLTLVDLNAAVQKAEITLEPLLAAEQPDEPKILAQIDRAALARTDLEKAHARMLLALRGVLTLDQWKKLKASADERGGRDRGRPEQPPPPPKR